MRKDIVAKVGEYQGKDGKTKGEYKKIGVILENSNGEYIMLDPDVNLAGVLLKQRINDPQKAGKMVMCSIFDGGRAEATDGQRNRSSHQGAGSAPPPQAAPNFDDDLPF